MNGLETPLDKRFHYKAGPALLITDEMSPSTSARSVSQISSGVLRPRDRPPALTATSFNTASTVIRSSILARRLRQRQHSDPCRWCSLSPALPDSTITRTLRFASSSMVPLHQPARIDSTISLSKERRVVFPNQRARFCY